MQFIKGNLRSIQKAVVDSLFQAGIDPNELGENSKRRNVNLLQRVLPEELYRAWYNYNFSGYISQIKFDLLYKYRTETFSLSKTLDEVSYDFIVTNFKLESMTAAVIAYSAVDEELGEWIKFFTSGKACYSGTGRAVDSVWFDSFQDAVDFIRI